MKDSGSWDGEDKRVNEELRVNTTCTAIFILGHDDDGHDDASKRKDPDDVFFSRGKTGRLEVGGSAEEGHTSKSDDGEFREYSSLRVE